MHTNMHHTVTMVVGLWSLGMCMVTMLAVFMTHWVYRWRNPRSSGRLPPGSMGIPLLGETLQFIAPHSSLDVPPFIQERIKRYGRVFRTSLIGEPVIISADPELSYFILQQERLFASWYPATVAKIFGAENLAFLPAPKYKHAKSLVWRVFGMENVRQKLIPEMEEFTCRHLQSWCKQPSIEVHDALCDLTFEVTAKELISYDPSKSSENLRKNLDYLMAGIASIPVSIPGTTFHRCLKSRKTTRKMLEKMMEERLASPALHHEDLLDILIEEIKKEGTCITPDIALDLVFGLLFASFDTTCTALTMAVKFITENPNVLEKLVEEHEEIVKSREDPCSGITWKEFKSMKFTSQVLTETARMANVAPLIFRKASQDYTTKDGYTIPAGWAVMVCLQASNMNPDTCEDPLTFKPQRWEGIDPSRGSKDYLAFGSGMRYCAGASFSKMQMSVFLHHLVTKYRWTKIKGGEIQRSPELTFPNGLHIQLEEKSK